MRRPRLEEGLLAGHRRGQEGSRQGRSGHGQHRWCSARRRGIDDGNQDHAHDLGPIEPDPRYGEEWIRAVLANWIQPVIPDVGMRLLQSAKEARSTGCSPCRPARRPRTRSRHRASSPVSHHRPHDAGSPCPGGPVGRVRSEGSPAGQLHQDGSSYAALPLDIKTNPHEPSAPNSLTSANSSLSS